jgi:hypothetical protein
MIEEFPSFNLSARNVWPSDFVMVGLSITIRLIHSSTVNHCFVRFAVGQTKDKHVDSVDFEGWPSFKAFFLFIILVPFSKWSDILKIENWNSKVCERFMMV